MDLNTKLKVSAGQESVTARALQARYHYSIQVRGLKADFTVTNDYFTIIK